MSWIVIKHYYGFLFHKSYVFRHHILPDDGLQVPALGLLLFVENNCKLIKDLHTPSLTYNNAISLIRSCIIWWCNWGGRGWNGPRAGNPNTFNAPTHQKNFEEDSFFFVVVGGCVESVTLGARGCISPCLEYPTLGPWGSWRKSGEDRT